MKRMLCAWWMVMTVGASAWARDPGVDFVVAQDGSGDFTTVTAALNALPMYTYRRTVILIKAGVYPEKIRIEPHYVTLRGEGRDRTIIRASQPRPAWQAQPDAVGPAVVNIVGDDVILEDLTVENSQPETGVHAFAVYGTGTRTVLVRCNLLSQGGDTVSLWNYKHGMYYHADCRFQGAVDFVCPRGWCFIRDSHFQVTRKTAALWHAGNYDRDQKFVLRNCTFDADVPYELGRHHYEAQFYLLSCRFSETMLDRPIYHSVSSDPNRNNPYRWGDRRYYHDCHRTGGDFDWFADNLDQAPGHPRPDQITAAWTFSGRWDPESTEPPRLVEVEPTEHGAWLTFNELVTVRGDVRLQTVTGKTLSLIPRRFTDVPFVEFAGSAPLRREDFAGPLTLTAGQILASQASARERLVGRTLAVPVRWRDVLNQPAAWYGGSEARRIADNVLLYQRYVGGWEKNIDMARVLTAAERRQVERDKGIVRATIDNGATTTQLRFLARVIEAGVDEPRYRQAFLVGLDYLLEAQYPNGGWPQFYPLRRGYYQHITYNDDAMINVMNLLKDIADGQHRFGWIDPERRRRCAEAIERGLDVILKTQVRVDGRLTVWCAQHDAETLAPAAARSYELVSLSGKESVGIVRYLMRLEPPSPEVRRAVTAACRWFEQTAIRGKRVVIRPHPASPRGFERLLIDDPDGGPLWARFVDIETNRPMFINRDGVVHDHYEDLDPERRDGYAYIGAFAAGLLERDYPAWQARWQTSP